MLCVYSCTHTGVQHDSMSEMMFVSFNSNTASVSGGSGTAYPSGAPEFTPKLRWDSCCSIFSFLCSVLQINVCPFCHCIVCPSPIYDFSLPLWYLQTFLILILHVFLYLNFVCEHLFLDMNVMTVSLCGGGTSSAT